MRATGEVTLVAAAGWCAPSSGERYPRWVLEPDCPWPVRAPRPRERPHVTSAMRLRWAEEDAWLARQVRLCAPLGDG